MHGFDIANPPFDRLTQPELHELTSAIDIGYFAPGEAIVRYEQTSDCLHVVIKGSVEGRVGDDVQVVLGPKDTFDSRAVVHGSAGEDFVAAEETLCFLIPRDLVLRLIRQNPAFAAFFYADISRKLDAFADARKSEGVESVLRARVRDARCGRAVSVDGSASIAEAGRTMRDHAINALFVRDGERVGVVTGMNLSKAVVLRGLALDTPIREICHFDVVAVGPDDFIFDALLLMTRHDKRRLAVRSGEDYVGFLEDIDLLGLFAGNSQLIPGRIDRARDLDDLAGAARDIQAQVERLHRQGLKVDLIAEITSDLNRRLFAKLFDMVAAPSIRQHGCLLLMGSEGRGEQTVRTDQDNGLLLARDVPAEDLNAFRGAFSGALDRFGFPPCPGNVMVRNPVWSQPTEGFVRQLQSWVLRRDADAAMNIAIFFDASAVAGNPALLSHAKRSLVALLRGEHALLARFAHLIETFATPSVGMLSQLMSSVGVGSSEIDLKKAGIFPIVHAARTLAIEREIFAPSTADRIACLVDAGALEPEFGREMVSALQIFMEYRLRSQLQALHRSRPEREVVLDLDDITAGDRDILRDALRIVRQVREIVRVRFNLAAF
jgi:CBS domain-containing protein